MTQHIRLDGAFNLRDLGGHATGEGRVVRNGCLFRSDELHGLTDDDVEIMRQLGIRVMFDLRNEHERRLRPNRSLSDVIVHERRAPPRDPSGQTLEEKVAAGIAPAQADDVEFGDVYIALLTHLREELKHIVELAADSVASPLLFHCAAGKDRTGITAAILLGLLGVPDDAILDDYERTTELWTPKRMEQLTELIAEHGLDADNLRLMVSARRPVLQRALDHLHATWGTFDDYAIDELGIDEHVVEALRVRLLS